MTRMEANESGSRNQQTYQSDVSLPQPMVNLLDARWKEQIQKCNQADAEKVADESSRTSQISAPRPESDAPRKEQKQPNADAPAKPDTIANKNNGGFLVVRPATGLRPQPDDTTKPRPKNADPNRDLIDPLNQSPEAKQQSDPAGIDSFNRRSMKINIDVPNAEAKDSDTLDTEVEKLKEGAAKDQKKERELQENFRDHIKKRDSPEKSVDSKLDMKTMETRAEEAIAFHRNTIAGGRALSEFRLENGTALPAIATDKRLLPGHNLDLGGEALFYLQMTKPSVALAKGLTKAMSKPGVETELKALDAQATKIDECVAKIEGKHDIGGAFSELKEFLKLEKTDKFDPQRILHNSVIEKGDTGLNYWFQARRSSNKDQSEQANVMIAKLFRDQALAKMAMSSNELDNSNVVSAAAHLQGTKPGRDGPFKEPKGAEGLGSRTPRGYDGATEMLTMAAILNPKNKDLEALNAINKELTERLKKATK
ncbi:MAG: hypothetical protein K2X93_04100 [Candidatus Obscuribacterales bacterium]|nr:hypothetical protein [Candidatus Obscuribacterales bacterium]